MPLVGLGRECQAAGWRTPTSDTQHMPAHTWQPVRPCDDAAFPSSACSLSLSYQLAASLSFLNLSLTLTPTLSPTSLLSLLLRLSLILTLTLSPLSPRLPHTSHSSQVTTLPLTLHPPLYTPPIIHGHHTPGNFAMLVFRCTSSTNLQPSPAPQRRLSRHLSGIAQSPLCSLNKNMIVIATFQRHLITVRVMAA